MIRIREHGRIDMQLATAIFGVSLFGLLMLYSASSDLSRKLTGNPNNSTHFLILQLLSFIVGFILWIIVQQVDYHRYTKSSTFWMVITLVLLLSVTIFSKGTVNGANRWISIAGQTFQPSEFAKLSFILFLGTWFSEKQHNLSEWKKGFVPFLVIILIVSALMMMQKDLGTLGVMLAVAFSMYIVSGARFGFVGAALAALGGIGIVAIKIEPYRVQRLLAFVNGDSSSQGIGYHITQAKIAIGLGGWFGQGFLQGTQKKGFLPEGHTDSIFAVIVEELGFLRASVLVIAFAFIAVRGMRVAKYAPDQLGTLIATGITVWFVSQAAINIAAMVSLIPLTGVPLPFISYGRTAIIALCLATGVLLNISRYLRTD